MTALLLAFLLARGDYAPGPLSEWYRSLRTPEGVSCCSVADCRPVSARPNDGSWEVWIDREWLPVPPERVLRRENADGRPVACVINRVVLCFAPGPEV